MFVNHVVTHGSLKNKLGIFFANELGGRPSIVQKFELLMDVPQFGDTLGRCSLKYLLKYCENLYKLAGFCRKIIKNMILCNVTKNNKRGVINGL